MGGDPTDILILDAKERSAEARLNEYLKLNLLQLFEDKLPLVLYHYTSSAATRAIISSGVMRAYNLGQMNDFAEGTYAATIMRGHIDKLYALNTDSITLSFLTALRNEFTYIDLSNVFSLSFICESKEKKEMWNLYSDRGQGFRFASPLSKVLPWAKQHKGFPLRCCYDSETLHNFCKQALNEMCQIYNIDFKAGLNPEPIHYARMFLYNVFWFAPAFKLNIWGDENEWRFVFVCPDVKPEKTPEGRAYIEIPLKAMPETSCPISEICAGPDCDYSESILPLQKLLYERGYEEDFPIRLSINHKTRSGSQVPIIKNPIS